VRGEVLAGEGGTSSRGLAAASSGPVASHAGAPAAAPVAVAAADREVAASVVAAAGRGDGEAFALIIRTYAPRLRATACQVLYDDQLVDDVLQDVFLAAYRALPKFRGDAALGTWLHRITYTTCAQYLRRAGRRALVMGPGESERDKVPVADHAESVCDAQRVRTALGRLPAEQRIAVLLVDRDGYDYRSAAKVLGIPRGTVASRLNSARAQLRAALGLGGGAPPEGR